MPKRPPPSVRDVIGFVKSRVPPDGARVRVNPFTGRRFHRTVVRCALDELHAKGLHRDLEPYDLKGTLCLWKGRRGKELARTATKRLLQILKARIPGVPLERLLPEITLRSFKGTSIDRFGTTLGGMLTNVYGNSPYRALKDLIDHDPELAQYRDFQPSDMRKAPQDTWISKGGKRVYESARRLTKLCLRALRQKNPELSMEVILEKANSGEILNTPLNRYGTTLGGALDQVYGRSPFLGLMDLCLHDKSYRKYLPAIRRRRYRTPREDRFGKASPQRVFRKA